MTDIRITTGDLRFLARLERERAPQTCAYFNSLLPCRAQYIHVRWSGEGCWIPLGDQDMPVAHENATSYPTAGQMIFYPGGYSKAELLPADGAVRFASKMGELAGNHFLTIVEGLDQLPTFGQRALQQGAQDIIIERIS